MGSGGPVSKLSIEVAEHAPGVVCVTVVGDLDISSAGELPERLALLKGDSLAVVVDLSGVEFIDSSGLNALVTGARAVEENNGSVLFAEPSAHVTRVFEIVKIAQTVAVEPSLESALRDATAARQKRLRAV